MTDSPLPVSVFHYTSAAGLLGILNARQIWLSDIDFLNDAQEMKYAARALADAFGKLVLDQHGDAPAQPEGPMLHRGLLSTLFELYSRFGLEPPAELRARFSVPIPGQTGPWEGFPFVASFCSEGDLLSMWRGYANGDGFAVEFDTQALLDAAAGTVEAYDLTEQEVESLRMNNFGVRSEFVPIAYGGEHLGETVEAAVAEMTVSGNDHVGVAADNLLCRLGPLLASTKHPAFQEEKEIRFMVFPEGDLSPRPMLRAGAGHLVPYLTIEFPHAAIRSIRVGPAAYRERSRDALGKFLSFRPRGEYEHLALHISETPLV